MLEQKNNKTVKYWHELSNTNKCIFINEVRRHEDLMLNEFVKNDLFCIADIIANNYIENLYDKYNIDREYICNDFNNQKIIKNNIDTYCDINFNKNLFPNCIFDFKINNISSNYLLENHEIINNLFFYENINKNVYGINLLISDFEKYNDRLHDYLLNVNINMSNSKFNVNDYNYCIEDLVYVDKNNNVYKDEMYSWYEYWNLLFNKNKLIEKRLNEWKNYICEELNNQIENQLNDSILNVYDNIIYEYTFNDKFKMSFEIDEKNQKIVLLPN